MEEKPLIHLDENQLSGHFFAERPSLLSSEYSANSYRGFLNLAIILLVLTNLRLVVENMMKYGFLLSVDVLVIDFYRWPAIIITMTLNIYVIAAVKIEQAALQKNLSEQIVLILQSTNAVAAVLIPSLMILYIQPNPASGLTVMVLVSILFCKLVSYAQVNTNLRIKYTQAKKRDQEKSKETLNYPFNLTLPNMYRFWCLPTLCYQLNYPKSPKVRKLFLLRRIIEASFFSFLIYVIVVQYIVPLVHNSVNSFMTNDIFRIAERLLKLAIPNLYVWLLGFYVVFHLYLNILAEIFQYGDRLFYKDWWNSTTLGYFWRTWNLPVHNWMALHIYIPAMKRGFTKSQASFLCFFISAIFHEIIVAVPFGLFKFWAFGGMMGQIPLIFLTGFLRRNQIGNILFWPSIVLGQPFLVLITYRDWYIKNYVAG